MKFLFTVRPDSGGDYEVTATTRDVLVWERLGKGRKISDLLGGGVAVADYYALAHAAARRAGLFAGALREFEETVDVESGHQISQPDEDDDEQDDGADPTQPAP